jgi:predicted RNA-binding Zn-ribbon protein involved in translation (DUF1610 family)
MPSARQDIRDLVDGINAMQHRIFMEMDARGLGAQPSKFSDLPCPQCGEHKIVTLSFTNKAGEHMHTHYHCTYWAGRADGGGGQCGWHDWSVPGWERTTS